MTVTCSLASRMCVACASFTCSPNYARLICLSRANGKVRWIAQLRGYKNVKKKSGPYVWFGPVMAGDKLWLTNTRGEIVAVSPTDGNIVTTIKHGTEFGLPPVVA